VTDDLNYLRSEAERLPNGTAAKALRMMQPDTITISRNCAEYFAERACTNDRACFTEVGGCVALDCHLEHACRAALEGER
jgi:hypothetical protein